MDICGKDYAGTSADDLLRSLVDRLPKFLLITENIGARIIIDNRQYATMASKDEVGNFADSFRNLIDYIKEIATAKKCRLLFPQK